MYQAGSSKNFNCLNETHDCQRIEHELQKPPAKSGINSISIKLGEKLKIKNKAPVDILKNKQTKHLCKEREKLLGHLELTKNMMLDETLDVGDNTHHI